VLTLADILNSDLPASVGKCASDVAGVASIVNRATERLLYAKEVGDPSWWGGWAELVFNVDRDDPFIVLPREFSTIISADVCSFPVNIANQFYSYLKFGFGRWPKRTCSSTDASCSPLTIYDRGIVPTFQPIVGTRKSLRFFVTDPADVASRILTGCLDSNGQVVRSLDGLVQVSGLFTVLDAPFSDLAIEGIPLEIQLVTSLQKDTTLGRIAVYQLDLDSGDTRLISSMDPTERASGYRKYYLGGLPQNCCNASNTSASTVQVDVLAKRSLLPVFGPTDFLLVQSIEALLLEAQAVRMSGVDGLASKSEAQEYHRQAIRLLNGQSVHFEGKLNPAVQFAPFGSARLSRQRIGTLT